MMSYSTASYDQLVRQMEDLRKENSHLRRELQDNSHHLSKLENETSDMKVSEAQIITNVLKGQPLLLKEAWSTQLWTLSMNQAR